MKSHLVLLPRVTLLDKELVKWKTESENISIAFQLFPLPASHTFCPNILINHLFSPVLPWVPIIDVDDGDVHSCGVVLTAIRSHDPIFIFSKAIIFQTLNDFR